MKQVIVKDSVKIKYFTRPMVEILLAVFDVWDFNSGLSPVITSAHDGTHMRKSLHYEGLALDLRTRYFRDKEDKIKFAQELRDRLGDDYDVVVERDHIHVEFDIS